MVRAGRKLRPRSPQRLRALRGGQAGRLLASDPTGGDAYTVKANPNNHNQVLVTDYGALYVSNDGGATFAKKYTSTDAANGLHVAGAFFNGNTVYVGTNNGLIV